MRFTWFSLVYFSGNGGFALICAWSFVSFCATFADGRNEERVDQTCCEPTLPRQLQRPRTVKYCAQPSVLTTASHSVEEPGLFLQKKKKPTRTELQFVTIFPSAPHGNPSFKTPILFFSHMALGEFNNN